MKSLSLCVLLALSSAVYGQGPSQPQPDTSGARLQQLLQVASDLQRAGRREQAAQALQQAEWERQGLVQHLNAMQAEVERIRRMVGYSETVRVHLQVMEVSLTKLKKLGFDMSKLQANAAGAPGTVRKAAAAAGFNVINDNGEAVRILATLRKDHLAKVLCEPTLVTLSGVEAKFHSGGEVMIPTPQNDGSIKALPQPYGTEVQFRPEILADRSVRLTIHCRLSELDHASATRVGNDVVPAIRAREISTDARIQNGHTLVLSGLVQSHVEAENVGIPWISEIPYAGAVFRRVKEVRNDVATFVLITPELADPNAPPARAGTSAPTSAVRPGNNSRRR